MVDNDSLVEDIVLAVGLEIACKVVLAVLDVAVLRERSMCCFRKSGWDLELWFFSTQKLEQTELSTLDLVLLLPDVLL